MRMACHYNFRSGRGKRAGFTLVEILAVVIILGSASAVIVPTLGPRNDLNAAAAARVIAADLMYAQNRAILTQAMRYVNFDQPNNKYALLISKPGITPIVYEPNPMTLANYVTQFGTTGPSGLRTCALQAVSVDGFSNIGFDELGQPYSVNVATGTVALLVNAATIPVKCGTFTLTVRVEPFTGAISVQ